MLKTFAFMTVQDYTAPKIEVFDLNSNTLYGICYNRTAVHASAKGTADGKYGKVIRRIQEHVTVMFSMQSSQNSSLLDCWMHRFTRK